MEERRTGKEPDSLFACRTARAGAFVHLFDYTGNRLESRVGQACHSAATACLRVRYRRVVAVIITIIIANAVAGRSRRSPAVEGTCGPCQRRAAKPCNRPSKVATPGTYSI